MIIIGTGLHGTRRPSFQGAMKLTPAYLSSNFPNIKELTSISLKDRSITHIDDISFLVNLKKLDLSGNQLRSGESLSGLQYCKSLTWLDLSGNQLSDIHFLLGLQNLSVLNISKNEMETIPEGISRLTNLKALILSENQIKSLENVSLPKTLNTLVLSKNQIEDVGKILLPLSDLQKLSFSHNKLHEWPRLNTCYALKEIRLNNNRLLKLPAKVGDYPPHLNLLDIGHNAVKDLGAVMVSGTMRHCKSLNLVGNPVWSDEVETSLKERLPALEILNSRRCRQRR